jgi:hypothetical protein
MCFEAVKNREVSAYFLNSINNNNKNSLIYLIYMSVSTIRLYNSIFLQNNPTKFCSNYSTTSYNLFFTNCIFSFAQKSEALVTISDCTFGESSFTIALNSIKCYYNAKLTCHYSYQGIIKLSFALTIILS